MVDIPFGNRKALFKEIINQQLDWSRYSNADPRWAEISQLLHQLKLALTSYPFSHNQDFTRGKMLESLDGMIFVFMSFPAHMSVSGRVMWEYENEMRRHNDDFSYYFRKIFNLPQNQIFS